MNIKSALGSIATFVVGVFLLSIFVSLFLGYFFGSTMRKPSTTIVVERPDNYRGWWGHYGSGLPGWGGGPRFPGPMPPRDGPRPPRGDRPRDGSMPPPAAQ